MSVSEADLGFYYDGLYGYIPLRPVLRDALNLKTMQRLRRLRQLATLELFFPGATHTRFAHSVGVFHIASRILDHLIDIQFDPELKHLNWPPITPMHVLATQLAALFHDVGHGPFSHVFELFCKRQRAYRMWQHEYISERLITEGIGEFNDIPIFLTRLRDSLESRGGTLGPLPFLRPENIAKMSQGAPPPADHRYLFLSQILKCPFDADRMDYLRRDAYYTGVETGRVDIWELVNNTTIGREEPVVERETFALRIDKRAAVSLEAFLLARDLMYRRVYYNKAHRGHQELIIRALKEIMPSYRPDDLVMKTDDEMMELFAQHNSFTRNVTERLTRRQLYEPIPFDINVNQDLDDVARKKWADLRSIRREEVFAAENRLVHKLALKAGETVVLDIEQIPLTDRKDYFGRYLHDSQTEESMSLLDLLPHLLLTRGSVQDARTRQEVDLGTTYLNMLSHLTAFAPPELCAEVADTVKQTLGQSRSSPVEIKTAVEREINKGTCPLKIVFDEFVNMLGLSGTARSSLWDKCLSSMCRHIEGIIQRTHRSDKI
jgi:HD superfamily phosphohydrolase